MSETTTEKAAPIANPSRPLWVASIHDPALVTERGTPGFDAALDYLRSRSIVDLARIPHRDGMVPVLVELAPLTPASRAAALGLPSEAQRRLAAAQYSARRVIVGAWRIEAGAVEGAAEDLDASTVGAWPVLTEKGAQRLLEVLGGEALDELGSVALQRASVHPRAIAPFRLPSPSGGG